MNKLKLFPIALTALVLGACSSEDVIDNGGQGPVAPGEKGYISLGINLPTTPSSRAGNDNFADGTASEYAVKDATLIIFEGTTEADATVTGVYDLGDDLRFETSTPSDDNITTTYQLTQAVNKPAAGKNLYALVVLNKGDIDLKDRNLTTLEKFTTIAQTDDFLDGSYILMTNAPLYTTPGGKTVPTNGKVVTLTEINPENVFTTEAEAKANPAANVYVERALAKVTVNANASGYNPGNGKFTNAEVKGYVLDVTNKTSYLVRNIPADAAWWSYKSSALGTSSSVDPYRFVGSASVGDNFLGDNLYRIYWGVDPNYRSYTASNYGSSENNGDFDRAGKTPSLTEVGDASYCKENTFNVANQKQDGTTRVIVAAKITVNGSDATTGTFYTLDNNKDVIYNGQNIENVIKSYFIENEQVSKVLQDNLTTGNHDVASLLDISFDKNAGDVKVKDITFIDGAGSHFNGSSVPAELKAGGAAYSAALTEINSHVYSCYASGIAYYPVMIKHFGDDLTPWSADNKTESYPGPDAEANWLGRYGVLRNNWYEINVTGIKSIGSADVPDVDGTPDDPLESWISVEINVLSWAKRTQNVDL